MAQGIKADIPTAEQFRWYKQRQDMKSALAKAFERDGYRVADDELDRIVKTPPIRNVFIVCIYNAERDRGVKAEYLYYKLGNIFNLTSRAIRDIVTLANTMPK
jgi:hypothetical protein